MNKAEYEEYRKLMSKLGGKFEAFVKKTLQQELKLKLDICKGKNEQFNIGESHQGFEIKFDDMFKKTGNLYIEVAEKASPQKQSLSPAGIYREDNTWIYVIGNTNVFWVYSKHLLRHIYEQLPEAEFPRVENKYGTSKGYLLRTECQDYYAALKFIAGRRVKLW